MSHLREKLSAARGKCRVDVAFWGGVVPDNVNADGELRRMVQVRSPGGRGRRKLEWRIHATYYSFPQMEGVCGFKCFLTHSGVDEFPCVNRAEVETALAELKVRLNSSSVMRGSENKVSMYN